MDTPTAPPIAPAKPNLIAALAGIAGVAILVYLVFSTASPTGFFGIAQTVSPPPVETGKTGVQLNPGESTGSPPSSDPSDFLARREYFESAFKIDRESYDIFEKASAFTGKPLSTMPAFFSLKNEAEIWENLPAPPADFSEIAFLLATGKYFSIAGLDERYWKQFEFYPDAVENGLKYWTEPDPKSWASNGYGTYPSEQWATLKTGDTETFEATVFVYTGYGVQTYQGVTLFAEGNDLERFDLSISPQTFLLEPTFPKFESEWVKKVMITGNIKEGTPKGEYTVNLNLGVPPEDKRKEWTLEHRNLYEDAAAGIRPSGNQIVLHILVE